MLQLTLDGIPAALQPGSTFKLTRPNPLLSSSTSDYTMEVQLPVDGCAANWEIFRRRGAFPAATAAALRPLVGAEFAARLVAPPLYVDGTAKLTSLSDGLAKVQIAAKLSAVDNVSPAAAAAYIDNLPQLGYFFRTAGMPAQITVQKPVYLNNHQCTGTPTQYEEETFTWLGGGECGDEATDHAVLMYLRAAFHYKPKALREGKCTAPHAAAEYLTPDEWKPESGEYGENGTWTTKVMYGTPAETDAVLFPVLVAEPQDGDTSNRTLNHQNLCALAPAVTVWKTDDAGTYYALSPNDAPLSPQPYLLPLLRDVFAAVGLTAGNWAFYEKNAFYASLVCVSPVKDNVRRCRALPHWTFAELITEMQNFLQCVVYVRAAADGKKYADLVPVSSLAADGTPLAPAATFAEATIETSTALTGAAAGNVCYDYEEANKQTELPLSALTSATVRAFATFSEMEEQAAADYLSGTFAQYLYRLTDGTGRYYAFLHPLDSGGGKKDEYVLAEVNQEAALWRDTTDDKQTKLRMVPASCCLLHSSEFLPGTPPAAGYISAAQYYTGDQAPAGGDNWAKVDWVTGDFVAAAPSRPVPWENPYTPYVKDFSTEFRVALRLAKEYPVYTPAYSVADDVQGSDTSTDYQSRLYLAAHRNIKQTRSLRRHAAYTESTYPKYLRTLRAEELGNAPVYHPLALTCVQQAADDDGNAGTYLYNYPLIYGRGDSSGLRMLSPFALGRESKYTDASSVFAADSVNGRLLRRYTIPSAYAPQGAGLAPLSPTAPYVIGGRPLLCQKLEYTIGEDGIVPPVTGYFAELSPD